MQLGAVHWVSPKTRVATNGRTVVGIEFEIDGCITGTTSMSELQDFLKGAATAIATMRAERDTLKQSLAAAQQDLASSKMEATAAKATAESTAIDAETLKTIAEVSGVPLPASLGGPAA
jgi:hypothetical protein